MEFGIHRGSNAAISDAISPSNEQPSSGKDYLQGNNCKAMNPSKRVKLSDYRRDTKSTRSSEIGNGDSTIIPPGFPGAASDTSLVAPIPPIDANPKFALNTNGWAMRDPHPNHTEFEELTAHVPAKVPLKLARLNQPFRIAPRTRPNPTELESRLPQTSQNVRYLVVGISTLDVLDDCERAPPKDLTLENKDILQGFAQVGTSHVREWIYIVVKRRLQPSEELCFFGLGNPDPDTGLAIPYRITALLVFYRREFRINTVRTSPRDKIARIRDREVAWVGKVREYVGDAATDSRQPVSPASDQDSDSDFYITNTSERNTPFHSHQTRAGTLAHRPRWRETVKEEDSDIVHDPTAVEDEPSKLDSALSALQAIKEILENRYRGLNLKPGPGTPGLQAFCTALVEYTRITSEDAAKAALEASTLWDLHDNVTAAKIVNLNSCLLRSTQRLRVLNYSKLQQLFTLGMYEMETIKRSTNLVELADKLLRATQFHRLNDVDAAHPQETQAQDYEIYEIARTGLRMRDSETIT